MSFKNVSVRLKGVSPLLMHNGQLADPRNDYSRALKKFSGKRNKTDSDHEQISSIEFQGGLYFDDEKGPYIPSRVIDATIKEGAKKKKKGSVILSSFQVIEEVNPLIYKGPKTREGLWDEKQFIDIRGAGVKQAKVMRTRPRFNEWALEFSLRFSPLAEVNVEDIEEALRDAGVYSGVGDYTDRFGKFVVDKFEVQEQA